MSLAKHPASTVQILGAEKALFRGEYKLEAIYIHDFLFPLIHLFIYLFISLFIYLLLLLFIWLFFNLISALKTKHDTPKYGLIYHASLVGQAKPQHKGKVTLLLRYLVLLLMYFILIIRACHTLFFVDFAHFSS